MILEEQNQPIEEIEDTISDVIDLGEADINYKKAFINQIFSFFIQVFNLIKKMFTRNGLIISIALYIFINVVYFILDKAFSFEKANDISMVLTQGAIFIGSVAGGFVAIAGIWMGRNYMKNRQDSFFNNRRYDNYSPFGNSQHRQNVIRPPVMDSNEPLGKP